MGGGWIKKGGSLYYIIKLYYFDKIGSKIIEKFITKSEDQEKRRKQIEKMPHGDNKAEQSKAICNQITNLLKILEFPELIREKHKSIEETLSAVDKECTEKKFVENFAASIRETVEKELDDLKNMERKKFRMIWEVLIKQLYGFCCFL